MAVIDGHCHVWGRGFVPPAFFARAAAGWAAREAGRTPAMILPRLLEGIVDETGDDFVANMDRAGVDVSLVMMLDVGGPIFGEEPAVPVEAQFAFYAALQARHPGRILAHAMVDHRRPGCLDLVRRAAREFGLVGLGEVTPDPLPVDHPDMRPLMRLCAELGLPVQVHTRAGVWTDMDTAERSEANPAHPAHVASLARALPELRVILCHAGFPHWWQRAGEAIADCPNAVLDVSNWNEMLDEPDEVVARLATWRGLVGADRILFASDQPSGPRFTGARSRLPEWVALFRDLPAVAARAGYRFTREEADGILGGNAARVYGLPPRPAPAVASPRGAGATGDTP